MMGKIRQFLLIGMLILVTDRGFGQVPDSTGIRYVITLDSFILTEVQHGFDVEDFVRFVQEDTSFYEAFRNLRRIQYNGSATVRMFDEDHLNMASYSNRTEQQLQSNCRWMDFNFEVATGDFFDKHGDMNYYTARMFAYIFLYKDTICNSAVLLDNNLNTDTKLDERKEQLKTLIFNPGQPVENIPLIKEKMEIFSPEMQAYYDYSIEQKKYATGVDCYVFTTRKKPDAQKGEDVVINELITWFDKKTMQIVARHYSLSYFTRLFDFDVVMDVKLANVNGYQVPVSIQYNGYWDIPARKPEIGSVQIAIW